MSTFMPSPMDMTTVPAAKSWANIKGNTDDINIQACLTAASIYFLQQTGLGSSAATRPTGNPFVQPVSFSETYDGNGNDRLYLHNRPIISVANLTIGGIATLPSTAPGAPGFFIDSNSKCLVISSGQYSRSPRRYVPSGSARGGFARGTQNVIVDYTAGYALQPVTNELQTILEPWAASTVYAPGDVISAGGFTQLCITGGTSGTSLPTWALPTAGNKNTSDGPTLVWQNTGVQSAPLTVCVNSIANGYPWIADGTVAYFADGTVLTPVLTQPAEGEYFIQAPGVYLFNVADGGKQILMSYSAAGTPADVVLAIYKIIALNYKRRDWVGISSLAMKDVGQTTYIQMDVTRDITATIRNYQRTSISS